MAEDTKWHRFYINQWNKDETQKLLTTEQVGAYWLLLVHQMGEGDLPSSVQHLATIARVKDKAYFESEVWPAFGHKFESSGREGRIHHPKCTSWMAVDAAAHAARIESGKRMAAARKTANPFGPTKNHVMEMSGEVAEGEVLHDPCSLLIEAGRGVITGSPGKHSKKANGYSAAELRLVAEYTAAGEHFIMRKKEMANMPLALLLASNFDGTVQEARAWDKRGRTNVEVEKLRGPEYNRPYVPQPDDKPGNVKL